MRRFAASFILTVKRGFLFFFLIVRAFLRDIAPAGRPYNNNNNKWIYNPAGLSWAHVLTRTSE